MLASAVGRLRLGQNRIEHGFVFLLHDGFFNALGAKFRELVEVPLRTREHRDLSKAWLLIDLREQMWSHVTVVMRLVGEVPFGG